MSSKFNIMAADTLAAILEEFGEPCTLTDGDGLETAFTGNPGEQRPRTQPAEDGRVTLRTALTLALAAEIPNVARGQTIAADAAGSPTWTVGEIMPLAGGLYYELSLTRPEIVEKSRRGYRLERE